MLSEALYQFMSYRDRLRFDFDHKAVPIGTISAAPNGGDRRAIIAMEWGVDGVISRSGTAFNVKRADIKIARLGRGQPASARKG